VLRSSRKFAYSGLCEVHHPQHLQPPHNNRRYRPPLRGSLAIGVGLCRSASPIHCGPVSMPPPGKEAQRGGEYSLGHTRAGGAQ
jgi:hypothetical protein